MMNARHEHRWVGLLLSAALLWSIGGALFLAVTPMAVPQAMAQSANPCNPNAARAANPCNPCAAKTGANPCAPKAANPCNPCAAKANPCNPCAAKANPCNPCAAKANPCAAKAANPCNPCATQANPCNPCGGAQASPAAGTIGWGKDYVTYDRTTGFVPSASHGGRLVVTYVSPAGAAAAYRANARLVRAGSNSGFRDYPTGTVIVKESFERGPDGKPARRGPVFFMRKEAAGYDASGENWRYAFTQADFTLIGEGVKGNVAFCKACHAAVQNRHFVYAQDR